MIYYLCPGNNQRPKGGQRRIYRHVDVLRASGFDASVVHGPRGHRLTWFDNAIPVMWPKIRLAERDLLVIPEVYGEAALRMCPGIPRVILNLNALRTPPALLDAQSYAAPNNHIYGVVCNSKFSHSALTAALPDIPVYLVPHGIDGTVWQPGGGTTTRRIAYMPRKMPEDAERVIRLLRSRPVAKNWEFVPIHDVSESSVASVLKSVQLFLSFGHQEGFGRPPAEAIACGASVIGFSGHGGSEVFQYTTTSQIPDGDIFAMAEAVEEWLGGYSYGTVGSRSERLKSSQRILADYPLEREAKSLIDSIEQILVDCEDAARATTVLTKKDLRLPSQPRASLRDYLND